MLSIGDPTVAGWMTVVVYFAVGMSCLKVFNETKNNQNDSNKTFWLF